MKSGRYAGMALDGAAAEIAVIRADERGVSVEERSVEPLPAEPAAALEAAARCRPPPDAALAVGLPGAQALLRPAFFPTRDPAELRSMAELFAEGVAPLPMDQMCFAFEDIAATEAGTHVWIALARRSTVDEIGAAFRRAGAPPERVDLNLLGWWEGRSGAEPAPARGRRALVRVAGAAAEALALDRGIPVAASTLPAENAGALADALARFLSDLEWQHGALPLERVEISVPPAAAGAAEPDAAWRDAVRAAVGADDVTVRPAAECETAEGLARRAAREAPPALNLAPDEWRREREQAGRRRALRRAAAALALAWAAVLAVFYGGLRWQRARAAEDARRAAALKGPADAALELRNRLRSFESYTARTHSALEALREVSERLPPGVELTSFNYRKNAAVALRGLSDRPEAIYDFLQALEQSPLFTKIESGQVQSRIAGGTRRSEFSVTAHLPGREGAAP